MVGFIRRNAAALGLLIVLGVVLFDCAGKSRDLEDARIFEDSAAVYRGQRNGLRAEAADLERRLGLANQRADSLAFAADSIDAMTPRVLVRWDTLAADATAAEIRAVADSTIAHLTDVAAHWREAFIGRSEELAALQDVTDNLRAQLEASTSEARVLIEANERLKAAAGAGPPIWIPVALIGGGAAIGAAVDGVQGAAKGAGAGLGLTITYLGVKELARVRLPRLPWPFR